MSQVKRGDPIVVGNQGVQVTPLQRARGQEVFSFMGSAVSSERPKGLLIAGIAREMKQVRAQGGKILVVLGPAVIHTGAVSYTHLDVYKRQYYKGRKVVEVKKPD